MLDEDNNNKNDFSSETRSEVDIEKVSIKAKDSPKFDRFEKSEDLDTESRSVEAVYTVPVTVSALLGTVKMPVSEILKLRRGAVVELERRVGDPIDILINNRLVARGEIIIIEEKLGITMTEIIKLNRD